MNKKCLGCGVLFQNDNPNSKGYVNTNKEALLCERCFRIKNYGDYKLDDSNHLYYKKIFDKVCSKNSLVLFLCDIFDICDDIKLIEKIKGKSLLVITKMDIMPKSIKEEKIRKYIQDNYNLKSKDIMFISSYKKYNIDNLINYVLKNKKDNNVYVVGNTNAGKSSLINSIINALECSNYELTTSIIPSTTLDILKVKINDNLTLIDTPGLINDGSYINVLSPKDVKKIISKKEIKPKTYQIKPNTSILIGNYARLDYRGKEINSITIYVSNNVLVKRINMLTNKSLKKLKCTNFNLEDKKDIVIKGLCFCKITKKCDIDVYAHKDIKVYSRNNLI